MNNAYFESNLKQFVVTRSEEELRARLKDVEDTLNSLETTRGWDVLLSDAKKWKELIDDNWQDIFDKDKLDQMRAVKQAYKFILSTPNTYRTELNILKGELESRLDQSRTEEQI